MSNARPMTVAARLRACRWSSMTPRQVRQFLRMGTRQDLRASGDLTHGASGVKVRKPIPRNAKPPSRGSWATHVLVAPPGIPGPVRTWKRVPR